MLGGLAVFFFFSPRRPVDPMEVKTAYAKLWVPISYKKELI